MQTPPPAEIVVETSKPKPAPLDPFAEMMPEISVKKAMDPPDEESFETIEQTLPCILVAAAVDEIPVAGLLTLTIAGSGSAPVDADVLPVSTSSTGVPLTEITIPAVDASRKGWDWPEGATGELHFDPASSLPGPRRVTRADAQNAAELLISGALGSLSISPEFALGYDFQTVTSGRSDNVRRTLYIAAMLKKPWLLLPENSLDPIVDYLQETEELKMLFTTELVGYATDEQLRTHLGGETLPTLEAASSAFAEIEAVSSKMPLPELARNAKVQERLEGILADCPYHLSARIMLEFGRKPVSPKTISLRMKRDIDRLIAPFKRLDDGGFDSNEMKAFLDSADLGLSELRTELPPEIRDYHGLAEDLVEAAGLYLSLSNKTTSTASQRLREARSILAAIAAMDVKLAELLRE